MNTHGIVARHAVIVFFPSRWAGLEEVMAWETPFDPFEALSLERDATPVSIKTRYHQLARRYHPNGTQGSDESKAALSEHFYHIHQAWQLLRQTDKRRRCAELLDLYDLHEVVLEKAADLLDSGEPVDGQATQHTTTNGQVSSDADDDDLPRIAGLRKRATFDESFNASGKLGDVLENGGVADLSAQRGRQVIPTFSPKKSKTGLSRGYDNGDQNAAAERRKQFDNLRKKELEAFYDYRDAMVDKFEAEEAAERCRDRFERARWRREYFERAPRDTSAKVKLMKLFTTATKAFANQKPVRRRNRSTVSNGGQMMSNGNTFENAQLLTLPARTKSIHRRGWSNDISGDQTSSDENSSGKATSPSRSPRPTARPRDSRHRRWDSVPAILPMSFPSLPNHDPISPITGPGPKVFIRTPTNLNETMPVHGSDADSASASSRSPSPRPGSQENNKFTLVPARTASDLLGCSPGRRNGSRSRSRSGERQFAINDNAHAVRPHSPDECQFVIKQIGAVQSHHIPFDHVYELTIKEKQALGVEPDTDMDPSELLQRLSGLDSSMASKFVVKPDIKETFRFRLIYGHREVVKQQQQRSFIALSYRRKLHVAKHQHHFTLPLEKEMFQAVWDERLSDNEGVWVDQICIDQDNDVEKTVSMSAMDMVYRSARSIVVVLDGVLLEASEARLLESHMDEYNRQVQVPANKRFRRRQPPYLEAHDDLFLVLRKLMRSSWFRRAWCRHEMRLAQEHVFLVPCKKEDSSSGSTVLRFTGKCLTHFLALATEVPFEHSIEAIKAPLYAFFRDRSKLPAQEQHLHAHHHGNFTTVVAEVFSMEAGGDPRIPEEQRAADARCDLVSIILNTLQCGLALHPRARDRSMRLSTPECYYMLLLLALAARDPGALCSVGPPMRQLPLDISNTWLFAPSVVDSGLNNHRTLNRLPDHDITTHTIAGEQFVQLDLKFLQAGKISRALESPDMLALAEHFVDVCDRRKLGRNRKRYLVRDSAANRHFGSMREVYVQTLACVLECGPQWVNEVCHRYGMSRSKYDLQPAYDLLVALKNTSGRWPESAWSAQAAGFIMDFVNFLIIRGLPQRQIVGQREEWRPIWVSPGAGGKVLTFVPPGEPRAAIPAALLDEDYSHCSRVWVLEPRGQYCEESKPHYNEWSLLGKTVMFSDEKVIQALEVERRVRGGQKVFGRRLEPA